MNLTALLTGGGAPTESDPEQLRILAAARAEFVDHGYRSASVGNIAKRAKVSRPTVNRRFGDKQAIFRAVITSEVVTFFAGIETEVLTLPEPTDRVVAAFVLGVRGTRDNPLVAAIRKFEPELAAGVFLDPNPENREMISSAIAFVLTTERLPFERARAIAEILIRITASLLFAPASSLPIDTDEQTRELARQYFVPIIENAMH